MAEGGISAGLGIETADIPVWIEAGDVGLPRLVVARA